MPTGITCEGESGSAVVDVVISGIHNYQQKVTQITAEELAGLMQRTWADIQTNFPKQTGATAAAIKLNQLGPTSWEIAVEGRQYVKIFNYIEYGTVGHGPKSAKALHWVDEEGKDVFVRWVRGIPAHYVVRVALEKLSMEINNLVKGQGGAGA